MQIPFVDLKTQYRSIRTEIDAAIGEVLQNASFILGKSVADFEEEFGKAHGVRYCYGVSSGTDGNHMVLWALGVGPGDEVIMPANTFIATAWGATLLGAIPVFIDCEPGTFTLDPSRVEEKITPRTKAIVAVHLYGQPAEMEPLAEISRRRGIHLVEDCAQAHFAEYRGRRVGGLSRAASFSFYPGKNLGAYGEGGAVVTDDPELARKFRMMRDHGSEKKYEHELYGHNYRMEGIQGAVLGVKMKHIGEWTEARRRNAALYTKFLSKVPHVITPVEGPGRRHVYHLYVIMTPERDRLKRHLETKGVSTGLHYPVPLHRQPVFGQLGYREGDFPVTESAAQRMLSLPMYPELTGEQIEYVCNSIRDFFD